MTTRIAFIGGGNMAASLAGGLIAAGAEPDSILLAEPNDDRRAQLAQQFAVLTTSNNLECLTSDVVVLAVKPQVMQTVCRQLAGCLGARPPLFVSIAAGIRTADIARWLGHDAAIVRCMPNTPALIQCGATALFASPGTTDAQKQLADDILSAAGITTWVRTEDLLDVVTALSGSGPAYFFLLMEAMRKTAVDLGLDQEVANRLTLQTALGAARMANENAVDLAELRARVTSKGGTTAAAIASLEHDGFNYNVGRALQAAYDRSRELADELGKDNNDEI